MIWNNDITLSFKGMQNNTIYKIVTSANLFSTGR